MLSNTYSAINNNHYIYNPFNTTLGVVQGSVISPLLYGVFVNDLITELDASHQGIYVNTHHIPCLLYCDDIILTTDSLSKLKKLLLICENHSKLWNYQFNPKKCNLITHNVKEPINKILSTQTSQNKKKIQKEYINQIPFYYKNHSLKNITSAPLILLKYLYKTHYVYGYDINGIKRYWSINVFEKHMRKTITEYFKIHKKETNIQFLIYWKSLNIESPIAKMKNECKMYNKKIKYKSCCRYLGAQLCDIDQKCIISESKTTDRFIKRMFLKENQLLHSLQIHYAKIHLNIKLPLIKTFFLAYTEIFAKYYQV